MWFRNKLQTKDEYMSFPNLGSRCIQIFVATSIILNPLCASTRSIPLERQIEEVTRDQTPEELARSIKDIYKSIQEQGYEVLPLLEYAYLLKKNLSSQYQIELSEEQFQYICDLLKEESTTPIEKSKHHRHKYKHRSKKREDGSKFPPKMIGGFLKILVGGLLFVVPVPLSSTTGLFLIGNGINDLIDTSVEEEEKRIQQS
jgi:hypothetical protein